MSDHVSVERYRCPNIRRFPIGNNSDLVYFTDEKSAHMMPSEIAKVLDSCQHFQPLETHLEEIRCSLDLSPEQVQIIRKLLSDFVTSGMLISDRDLLSRCVDAVTSDTPTSIASIGFVTRNRTDKLERALVSYIENSKQFGRRNDFVVVDDSDEVGTRNQHRRTLRWLGKQYDVEIYYAAQEEKFQFAESLVAAGLPPEVVNFALFDVEKCGCSIGANRNALLLHTAGDLFFSADDDTVCRIAVPPGHNDGLTFLAESEPTEFWFFPDREAVLRFVDLVDEDFLSAHEQLLGRGLGNIVRNFSQRHEVQIKEVCMHLLRSMQAGTGKVRVTFNGLFGDSGMSVPVGLLSKFEGYTHARLVRSEADYYSACTSREVLRAVSNTTICHGTYCMSGFLGLDNRTCSSRF